MSAFRQVSRVLNRGFINVISKRGYAAEAGDEMSFTFAGANEVFYDSVTVKQVDVPSFSGNFGILPKHVPTLAVLQPGVVTVFESDNKVEKFFVSSGTVTINEDNSVQILAEEAHPLDRFDSGEIKNILREAHDATNKATTDVAKAEALIVLEVAEKLNYALVQKE